VLLASFVVFTRYAVRDLQGEARRSSEMFARVFARRRHEREREDARLFDLVKQIREQGIPIVVTDLTGRPN